MQVIDILRQAKRPLFTFELVPPLKGGDVQTLLETVRQLSQFEPAYINVTNHQQEVVYLERPDGLLERRTVRKRPGTIALSALIQYTFNIPVVAHLICGGMDQDQLEDALVELNFLGIENVLALRGDPPNGEKRFVPVKGGYEHSRELVSQINDLNMGRYLDQNLQNARKTHFCIGVAGYPEKHAEAPNLERDIEMLKHKVDSGAHYIVTQMFFDNAVYYRFVDACRKAGITVPIIPGLKPIGSKRDLATIPQTFHVDFPS
jgi:methylenetetrahydrofolate reductase (NADPH)